MWTDDGGGKIEIFLHCIHCALTYLNIISSVSPSPFLRLFTLEICHVLSSFVTKSNWKWQGKTGCPLDVVRSSGTCLLVAEKKNKKKTTHFPLSSLSLLHTVIVYLLFYWKKFITFIYLINSSNIFPLLSIHHHHHHRHRLDRDDTKLFYLNKMICFCVFFFSSLSSSSTMVVFIAIQKKLFEAFQSIPYGINVKYCIK